MINDHKYIFFGTPEFAAVILEKLIKAGWRPAAVVCNPDRPQGRKKIISPPPVKVIAQEHNIKIYQPEKLDKNNWDWESGNWDFFIVAAYGRIIPKEILAVPRLGAIGVHPSLLPKYRGPSPIQTAILNGDEESGATLFLLDEKLDHGSILTQKKCEIQNLNFEILQKKLAELSANLLMETLPKFLQGEITPQPQDETEATDTKKFTTEDGLVDLEKENPFRIERKIRALNPEPGVYTFLKLGSSRKRVKLLEAEIKNSGLLITKIQPESQKPRLVKILINS